MTSTRGIIEHALENLDRVVTVLSHIAVEDLETDVMQAVAYGGFEMASSVMGHLERMLPHLPTGDDERPAAASDEAASAGVAAKGPLTDDRVSWPSKRLEKAAAELAAAIRSIPK